MDLKKEASEGDGSCKCESVTNADAVNSTDVAGSSTAVSSSNTGTTDGSTEEKPTEVQNLSKRQLRKLKKHENWLKYKPIKRAKDKEKKKQRRRDAKEKGEEPAPSRKRLKLNTMAKSDCRVSVAIDCSFDSYMQERDILKLGKQIRWCYSTNRRAANPVQLHVCGIHGQIKTRLDGVGDYINWDINSSEKGYEELFDIDSMVYLSSDSPNILTDLEPDKVYIIGGLVDHNHHKGLCHQVAVEKGLAHAQLPISEYIQLKSRKVLTINHVFEILLSYTETKDWQKAFYTVLPQRKGVQLKDLSGRREMESVSKLSSDEEPVSKLSSDEESVSKLSSDEEESDRELSNDNQIINSCDNVGSQGHTDSAEGHDRKESFEKDCDHIAVCDSKQLDETL
ncbi:tRNA methyltransferase 10 homolog A-like isoform X1 [Mizuhopecten yessoensis]|uniref:tRNA methyltransferase 10 homolog A-like isoform X1 n=1 Tax=Mizuhopecten yessoensis TaxID=6573 RepID=UPI000B457E61|nr:tRNA methyltransferase 10 homolog A-like isoform X1 [Mizuhopecten yessoensis]